MYRRDLLSQAQRDTENRDSIAAQSQLPDLINIGLIHNRG